MDIKDKRKQYYIDNRNKIIERNKQCCYDNIEEKQRYNAEYWSLNCHKYIEKRKENCKIYREKNISKYNEYQRNYRERNKKVILENIFFKI